MKIPFKIPKWRIEDTVGVIIVSILSAIFFYFYFKQEEEITRKLEECSFFTIITPIRMPSINIMYFYYYYNNKRYEGSTDVGSEDVGMWHTKSSVMSKRYWVQVYCDDFKTDRVRWEFPVPDTLQYIPTKGWNKIPYGLDKIEK